VVVPTDQELDGQAQRCSAFPSSGWRVRATELAAGRHHRLLAYALRYWRSWALVLVVSLVCAAFGLLQAWPMKILFDHVIGGLPLPPTLARVARALPWASSPRGLLGWVVLAGLLIFAANSLVDVVLTCSWVRVGQRMVYDLAGDLFAHIQRRSLLFHCRSPVGDSISRITSDCWCLHTMVDNLIFKPKLALISVIAMVGLMAQLDLGLTLLSVAAAPLMAGSALLFGRSVRAVARRRRDIQSRIHSHLQRTLSGIAVVQAFGREEHERRRFAELADASIEAQQSGVLMGSLQGLATGLLTTMATVLILWVGAHRVREGNLTVGSILVFLSYLGLLQSQLQAFTGLYASLQGAAVGMERVLEVLDSEHEVRDRPGAIALPAARGHLRIEHVRFGYESGRPVLRDLCLEIQTGETVAIIGATGTGKSTIIGLIPRFFDPWSGQVTLDGHDLRDLKLRTLRSNVAVVLQEPLLLPISIAENIAVGRPGATASQVETAARAAGAHDFIMRMPRGYDTILGERGATLSGGERQRLTLARALVRDAPILLLDEPTSALDLDTERLIMEAVRKHAAGRTTLIIAHRLTTIQWADRVLVLRDGALVAPPSSPEPRDHNLQRPGAAPFGCGGQSATPILAR